MILVSLILLQKLPKIYFFWDLVGTETKRTLRTFAEFPKIFVS